MSKKVAVILSGCGFMDGAEIQESVSALLALSQAGAEVSVFAPDVELDVVDHLAGAPSGEKRNVLAESARIARGKISPLKDLDVSNFDALLMPGGFGAAKNLTSFAEDGPSCTILPELEASIQAFHSAGKPVGAICIAPAVVAKALGAKHPTLTIGNDSGTASALEALGAKHQDCPVTECVVDSDQKVVTTPAYMYEPSVAEVFEGISKCVTQLLAMA